MKRCSFVIIVLLICCGLNAVTIDQLLSNVEKNNSNVIVAKNDLYQASLDLKDAKSSYQPTISLQMTGSYIGNPIDAEEYLDEDIVELMNGDSIKIFKDEYSSFKDGMDDTFWSFGLTAIQPIFTWGKISNSVNLAEKVYDVRVLNYDDTLNKAKVEVKTRSISLFLLSKIRNILLDQQDISTRLVSISEDSKNNGMLLETEALKVKVDARKIDVALKKIDQQIVLIETELKKLTGVTVSYKDLEMTDADVAAYIAEFELFDFDKMLDDSLSDARTTFKMLQSLSVVADYANKIAEGSVNWKPDFAIVATAGYGGSKLPGIQDEWKIKDDWNATVTVALQTTVWDGGKTSRAVEKTAIAYENTLVDIEAAKDTVKSTFIQSKTDYEVCKSEIDYLGALADQLDSDIAVKKTLMDSGYGSEIDWLQARIERKTCEIDTIEQQISLISAANTLEYLATN